MSDSNSKRYIPNPLSGFRKVVDSEIKERFSTREEVKQTSQILLVLVAAAAAFLMAKIIGHGFTIKSSWLPLLIISIFVYIIWRMHVVWIYGTIQEMAGESDDDTGSEQSKADIASAKIKADSGSEESA